MQGQEKHRNWKLYYGTTIRAFGQKEWSKAKLEDFFFIWCLFQRKNVGILIFTCPPFQIPIYEAQD